MSIDAGRTSVRPGLGPPALAPAMMIALKDDA